MALTESLPHPDQFVRRHIGPNAAETGEMLALLGFKNLDELADAAVPGKIRLNRELKLPAARSEFEALAELRRIAGENKVFRSFIGQGYYDCITPPVIQRNVLENPGWYTQYTPYQAEISQGRLEALLNFQTMVTDLTALDIANASLLDEATACAEAMMMSHRFKRQRGRLPAETFSLFPKLAIRKISKSSARAARRWEWKLSSAIMKCLQFSENVFGALVQYPDTFGAIHDFSGFAEKAHAAGAMLTVATDLLALTLIKPPGEFGADIAVGSAQRFGVPLGYGGPHAAFFATRDEFKRQMPGRIVGVSKDSRGKPALRLALGTREQHIRREKATSNICTAQALLANMASLYACYHGPEGLKKIATRVHSLTQILATGLEKLGFNVGQASRLPGGETVSPNGQAGRLPYFDTLAITIRDKRASDILKVAEAHGMNFRAIDDHTIGISLDETTSAKDVAEIWQIFNGDKASAFTVADLAANWQSAIGNRHPPFSSIPSSTATTARPRCSATSSGWNRATSRSRLR